MDALAARRTNRAIATTPLSLPILSNLLWAACGINRAGGPFSAAGRTAASAGNSQEVSIIALQEDGAFRYDPVGHELTCVNPEDLRSLGLVPGQRIAEGRAPVQLLLVADERRLSHGSTFHDPGLHDADARNAYAFFDGGLVAQNIFLFAAANSLASWLHNCDREALHKALRLDDGEHVLFSVSVGIPDRPHG
jgi:nitroreductase